MTKNRETELAFDQNVFNNFEKFFDISHDLFCVIGYDGYFKKINPAVSELLEYSNEELLSHPLDYFIYSNDKKISCLVREELKKQIPLFAFENRYITKSGQIIWLLWSSTPVDQENLIYAVAKNITHKKELEEERKSHLKRLTKINNEFKQLSYSTVHDLRSPVNNMLTIFDLIESVDISKDQTLEFITILKATTDTLKDNLNDNIKRLNTNNQIDNDVEKLDLNNCLNEVLCSINSLIKKSKTTITIDFSKTNKILFKKSYLKSIFLNLITNAIKYAKPNTLPVITIRTERINTDTKLIISDDGIGFDMEKVKDKVFGLYQTFNDHIDSHGIGLYLVHNQVTTLGGTITLESEVNQGATFTITIKD